LRPAAATEAAQRLCYARLPAGEDAADEVAVEPRLRGRSQRRVALRQAQQHDVHAGARPKVAAVERMHAARFEPRCQQQSGKCGARPSTEALRRLALHDEILVFRRRFSTGQPAHDRRGSGEGDAGEDLVRLARQRRIEGIALTEIEPRAAGEAPAQPLHQERILLHGDHPPAALQQPLGDAAAAGADLIDQVVRTDRRAVEQAVDQGRVGEEVLRMVEFESVCGVHAALLARIRDTAKRRARRCARR
jgi:hypothetical protein